MIFWWLASCVTCLLIGWIIGVWLCSRSIEKDLQEIRRAKPIDAAEKIRIPATRSTDLVPEKLT